MPQYRKRVYSLIIADNDIVMMNLKTNVENVEIQEFLFSKGSFFNDKGDRGKQYCIIKNS